MKYIYKVLFVLTLFVSAQVNASVQQCPSVDQIRNVTFANATLFGPDWIVTSSPFVNEDGTEWIVLVEVNNEEVAKQTHAIEYTNKAIKTAALFRYPPKKQGDAIECWYSYTPGFQVVAGYSMHTFSKAVFSR